MSTWSLQSRSRLNFRSGGDENRPLSSRKHAPAPVQVSTPQKLPTIKVTPATPEIPDITVTPATPVARSEAKSTATPVTKPFESPQSFAWASASGFRVARLHPSDADFHVAAPFNTDDDEDPLSFDVIQSVTPAPRPIASTPESRAQAARVAKANLFYHYSASPSPMSPNLHQGDYAAEAEERACAQVLGGTKDWWLDVRDLVCEQCVADIYAHNRSAAAREFVSVVGTPYHPPRCNHGSKLARYIHRLGAQDAGRIRYIVVAGPAYAFSHVPRLTSAMMQLCLLLPNVQRACVSIETPYPLDMDKKTAKGVAFWLSMLEGKLPEHERLQIWGLRRHPLLAKEWSRAKRKWYEIGKAALKVAWNA